MLVLSRKLGEKIHIADDIVITIVQVQGQKVRLGIDAPKEVSVHRSEIYDQIRRAEARPDAGPGGA